LHAARAVRQRTCRAQRSIQKILQGKPKIKLVQPPPTALLKRVEEDGAERGGIVNGEDARQVTVRLNNIPSGLEASVAHAFRLAFGPRRQCAAM
jgi:hypothetical protein